MNIVRKIKDSNLQEIIDHRDNTSKTLIKCYTISQLSIMDWRDTKTIRKSGKYLPVRVDNPQNLYYYKNHKYSKPYSILRIRLDEIKYIFWKRNAWKKLEVYW